MKLTIEPEPGETFEGQTFERVTHMILAGYQAAEEQKGLVAVQRSFFGQGTLEDCHWLLGALEASRLRIESHRQFLIQNARPAQNVVAPIGLNARNLKFPLDGNH